MKKIVHFALFLLVSPFVFGQGLPNGNMEAWSSQLGEPEQPTGWFTANVFASSFVDPNNPTSVFKDTNAFEGNYAARIESVVLQTNPSPNTVPDTIGACITGTVNFSGFVFGFPYTEQAIRLEYYAKYQPNGIDTAWAIIELTYWDGSARQTVAEGVIPMSASSQYNQYVLPFNYLLPGQTPDTCNVIFTSTGEANPVIGSKLWIDDVVLISPSSIEEQKGSAFELYPNPAGNTTTIQLKKGEFIQQIDLFNNEGKLVESYTGNSQSNLEINVDFLDRGVYFIEVKNTLGIISRQKLIKE